MDNALTFEPNKSDSMQTLMMNILGSFAQFERDLIVTRTQEENNGIERITRVIEKDAPKEY